MTSGREPALATLTLGALPVPLRARLAFNQHPHTAVSASAAHPAAAGSRVYRVGLQGLWDSWHGLCSVGGLVGGLALSSVVSRLACRDAGLTSKMRPGVPV